MTTTRFDWSRGRACRAGLAALCATGVLGGCSTGFVQLGNNDGGGDGSCAQPAPVVEVVPDLAGARWTAVATGTTDDLYAVWAASPNDAWAVGGRGAVLRWNGAAWARVPSKLRADLFAVWGASSTDVWIAGGSDDPTTGPGALLHWDGTALTAVASPLRGRLSALWGTGSRDVWLGGARGAAHWDGTQWQPSTATDPPTVGDPESFLGFAGTGTNDVVAAGLTAIYTRVGGVWHSVFDMGSLIPASVVSVPRRHAAVPCAAPTLADGGTGTATDASAPALCDEPLYAARAGLFAAGGQVWAARERGLVAQYNGAVWRSQLALHTTSCFEFGFPTDPVPVLRDVWGASASDVWVVGDEGSTAHWDGTNWVQLQTPTSQHLFGVHGSGGDAWAVGEGGTALRLTR